MNINSSNTVVVTTSLYDSEIAKKRINNMISNFNKYDIPIIITKGIRPEQKKDFLDAMFQITIKRFENFKQTNKEFGIICDDDFYPIDNFLEELNKTTELLPDNWRTLHLCPGFLWGRAQRNMEKIGQLNPENNIDDLQYDSTGRFFININNIQYFQKKIWLGGPIAILVNKNNIEKLIKDFTTNFYWNKQANDVILTRILSSYDYICRNPMLGYECEEGGSTTL